MVPVCDEPANWAKRKAWPAHTFLVLSWGSQSDRETIKNSNDEASVPQALAMMNGQLLPAIIGRYRQIMLTVNKAQYPDEKVDAVYLTILSRKTSVTEKQLWHKAQAGGLTSMDDLVFSLLNTQQFIFIQ